MKSKSYKQANPITSFILLLIAFGLFCIASMLNMYIFDLLLNNLFQLNESKGIGVFLGMAFLMLSLGVAHDSTKHPYRRNKNYGKQLFVLLTLNFVAASNFSINEIFLNSKQEYLLGIITGIILSLFTAYLIPNLLVSSWKKLIS